MSELLGLEDVAQRTGQPLARLRHWCATGELACERVPTSWAIREDDLPRVLSIAVERQRKVKRERAIALAVPRPRAPNHLALLVEQALELRSGEAATRPLAIDQQEYVIVTWPSSARAVDRGRLSDLAEALDGELLTDGSLPPDRPPSGSRSRPGLVVQRSG